ncbi:MAG: 4Fe-4S dicluster domain-containing protein [Acidobacteria bacterium]|nr:4Fe-4S dicluster domain-containing protein [Acidobacteriota bacterium]
MAARVVFVLLFAASLWVFARTVYRRLHFKIQKVPSLPFDHLGARLWRVFAEVGLQTRVIRDRPVAGILHALVMWGFFAFAWVSLRHLSLGIRGLDAAEPETSWYGAFAAVWAIAVLVGILGLSFRRFVLRPKVLGPFSATSGIVAGLIVVLMLSYLLGWRVLEGKTPAWQVNWWAHTLAFLGMLVVIPQSKHLHLLLGPVTVFFRPAVTSSIRSLRPGDDDDLGMVRFTDLAPKDLLDLHACVECGRCTQVCPANVTGQSLNPKEVILQMQRGLLAGGSLIAGTIEEVAGRTAWVTEDDLFQCLSCGACEQACPVGIEHVGSKILDLRRGLVSEGRTTREKLGDLFNTMERAPHNPWGVSHETRRKLLETERFPLFDGSQEWLLWLGCGASYDAHGQDVARAMKRILDAASVSWGVLAQETCCGEPGRRAGNEYLYLQLSEKLVEAFGEKKVKNLVTCDPHCTRMFDVDYRQIPEYEQLGVRVAHHSELLARLLPKLDLEPARETLTYHGATVREMEHHGKRAFCCGAGGAQLFIAEDVRGAEETRVNHRRFAEVLKAGVSTVAVACPYCPIMLKDAAAHAGRDDVAVLDIAEVVARRLRA